MSVRRGRRPGESATREAIFAAARNRFAEHGYDRTTIRAIAADAEVDPALVMHFFGSKERLFIAVMELPFDPGEVLPQILAGDRSTVGHRLAEFLIRRLEDPGARMVFTGMVRSAASEPGAAKMLRELVSREILWPLAQDLDVDDPELRGTLVGSQIVGLVMARYVVGVEPLASAEPDRLIEAIGPNLQRYLVEPLWSAGSG